MIVTANSAHSIRLSNNLIESRVDYVCNVTDVERGEKREVNRVSRFPTVNRLLPDTTYRVDCVAYRSVGVEACLEANTTVTTRELHLGCTVHTKRIIPVILNESNGAYVNISTCMCLDGTITK